MSKPTIVLFSSLLLPPSQTFVKAQGDLLQQFTPYYVGSRRVDGLNLPKEQTLVINQGGVWGNVEELLFKLSGISPKLHQQIQQLNPTLIHAQFGLSGALALPLARSLNIPLIVHFRGADATTTVAPQARFASLNHWIYFHRRNALKREACLFITVSKFIQEKLLEQGFPADRVITHYNGVNIDQFCPDPQIPREPVILFVGRLVEKKGCEYLIQAMAKVQSELPEAELVVIGDGPMRSTLEASAAQHLHHYQFLGTQSATVVKNWMNRARILIAPSVTSAQGDAEGLPNVVVEAQAMQLPVVSTLHAGIPEAVIHGETGFLAAERDAQGLAEYSLRLLSDAALWQSFSTRGREHMQTHFNRATQIQALENLYQSVANQKVSTR